jgi:hypothetical protein
MSEPIEGLFNPQKALAEARANEPDRPGRKLSFPEKCGVFAYLHFEPGDGEIKPTAKLAPVAQAFNVTRATLSALARCLTGTRYREVKLEYERLGPEAFSARYYTEDIHLRIQKARFLKPPSTPYAPNPAATKHSFKGGGQNPPYGPIECFENFYRIDWLDFPDAPEKRGWYYSPCNQDGSSEHWRWRGRQGTDSPFHTATQAWRELWRIQSGGGP